MDSQTDLGSVLGALGNLGTGFFNAEAAKAKAAGERKAALAGEKTRTNAQVILWVAILAAVGLVVVGLIFRGRR